MFAEIFITLVVIETVYVVLSLGVKLGNYLADWFMK